MNSKNEPVGSQVGKGLTPHLVLLLWAVLGLPAAEAASPTIVWRVEASMVSVPNETYANSVSEACSASAAAYLPSGGLQNNMGPAATRLDPNATASYTTCQYAAYIDPREGAISWSGYGGAQKAYKCPGRPVTTDVIVDCGAVLDRYHDKPKSCLANPQLGHPIYPLSGSKGLTEELGTRGSRGQRVVAGYDSRRKVPANDATLAFSTAPAASFGDLWSSNLHKSLVFQLDTTSVSRAIQASRGAGAWVSFVRDGSGNYAPDADVSDRLIATSSGWRYIDANARAEETYDAQGKLLNLSDASGANLSYTYSDASTPVAVAPAPGLLLSVQDQQGRSVQFRYEQPSAGAARIKQIIDPAGQTTSVAYNVNGNLSQFTWPDGKTRKYLYERSDIPWAVTGVIDENASRLATYGYDAQGRANDTQWAGGADHYSVSYTTPPSWNIVETYDSTVNVIWRDHTWQAPTGTTITQPNGSTSSLNTTLVHGSPRLTSQSQPAGSGCTASTSAMSYDANGNVASLDDFNGLRICYASDLTRNLEATRVEGLPTTQACTSVTPPNVVLPATSRKTSTQWHPDWRLTTKVAEPGKITTSVYNGQPDPFNASAIASCAPASALLPDGKPIAVLCREVEQATTDADGHLGFTAVLQAGVLNREQKWTYNAFGQVLTHDGPRTDVTDTTTYVYYADTTADHTRGDLQRMTNALGQITNYTKYSKHGQLLQSIDPNGVTTTHTYDLRQRLLSTSVAAQTTSYSYDPVGQLKRITQPDASWIGYDYDPAHRLIAVNDNQGNRIEFTLDNAGHRIAENTKDSSGTLKRALSRSLDALGRVQQTTGRE